MEKKIIKIGNKTYKLLFDDFNEDMDIDSLLKIDYSNLIGELITFPVIVNRFGNLLSEAESKVAEAKLNLEIFEAKTKERLRVKILEDTGKNPTVENLNNALVGSESYRIIHSRFIEIQKNRDYINSIFWSAKDKSEKLNKLSLTISQSSIPDSILEGRINNVLIKKAEQLIK